MTDPRAELAQHAELDRDTVAAIAERLDAMDRSRRWTREALRLIADNEGIGPVELAERLDREIVRLKTDVRRLKALGLTERIEVGYRITPRGVAFLAAEATAKSS